jgi:hypothetical protein
MLSVQAVPKTEEAREAPSLCSLSEYVDRASSVAVATVFPTEQLLLPQKLVAQINICPW